MKQESVCYLGIHPYSGPGIYETQAEFVRRRNRRIWNTELTQFLFIEECYLEDTINFFDLDLKQWRDKIILTHNADPACTDFKGVANMILETTPADLYMFWGAELVLHNKQAVGACVEYVYRNLSLPRKEIDVKVCFKTPYSVYKKHLKTLGVKSM